LFCHWVKSWHWLWGWGWCKGIIQSSSWRHINWSHIRLAVCSKVTWINCAICWSSLSRIKLRKSWLTNGWRNQIWIVGSLFSQTRSAWLSLETAHR
jgi:hypothetical protein